MFARCRITHMEFKVAVAKVGKYASSESGDTLEMIERPGGGLSFVLTDGQRSGKSAKAISNIVTRKAISLLADGVRDGAAARAASDYLYTYRSGKVIATLNILSVDLTSRSLVITRNNPAPVILIDQGKIRLLDAPPPKLSDRAMIFARRYSRCRLSSASQRSSSAMVWCTPVTVEAGRWISSAVCRNC